MRCLLLALLFIVMSYAGLFAQAPPPGSLVPGVSQELAKWRAARYSDVRYKLNLTLEKMSPVLKGTIEIRVNVLTLPKGTNFGTGLRPFGVDGKPPVDPFPPIILDWRKIKGHEDKSTISNVSVNGRTATPVPPSTAASAAQRPNVGVPVLMDESGKVALSPLPITYTEENEHLIFRDGLAPGVNVIKLDFTSPILTSGSAITRYVDKEDGAEYIYSLFVPSDASTAFPVFDQPDLKARFTLQVEGPAEWTFVSNTHAECSSGRNVTNTEAAPRPATESKQPVDPEVSKALRSLDLQKIGKGCGLSASNLNRAYAEFFETKPISTYVFAFAAGPWEKVSEPPAFAGGQKLGARSTRPEGVRSSGPEHVDGSTNWPPAHAGGSDIYVRKSQAEKFMPHAAEVFRLNREAVKYFEQYFDYKFPFPKYDLVLIPEFPFGGMEHAGATFLKESSVIFPQEPTKNDIINRATLIFHETAHQWFGDTVTMRWFDDLWLKEGFATFMGYKALEKIMPETNAWKVFYERIKQGAYQTDSTRGTTAIYQPIANLSAAKSAYGNIVYNKAPAFLRQAEFYLGEDKFQTAVRAFLKKHEFGNATWEDLVKELGAASGQQLDVWAKQWVTQRGMYVFHSERHDDWHDFYDRSKKAPPLIAITPIDILRNDSNWKVGTKVLMRYPDASADVQSEELYASKTLGGRTFSFRKSTKPVLIFPNYGDYGYGIFLLDAQSRDYVLKNIQNEKDPFLRSMMWGALWDSVREGEMDPRVFVELVVKVLGSSAAKAENHPVAAAATPLLRKEGRKEVRTTPSAGQNATGIHPSFSKEGSPEEDESTVATLLGRVGTALNYYVSEPPALAGGQKVGTGSTGGSSAGADKPGVAGNSANWPPADAGGSDLRSRVEDLLIERLTNAPTLGQRITYYRAFLNIAASEKARGVLKRILNGDLGEGGTDTKMRPGTTTVGGKTIRAGGPAIPVKTKDRFDIVTRLLILNDPQGPSLLADLERTETSDDAKRYAYAARAGIGTAENKAKYWNDFVSNKEISESWIEAAMGPWNSIRHSELTLPYLERALKELPEHKRSRKIFFVNGWLGAFIGGQRSAEALAVVNKFLADNPALDNDLRLKILENVDLIERAVNIRRKFPQM